MGIKLDASDPLTSVIQGCLDGDLTAQRSLFNHLLPYLKSAVRRYIWSETDVQDVLQEAFIRIFRHLHQFDSSRGQVQTWATKIAVNAAISFGMKESRPGALSPSHKLDSEEPEVFAHLNTEDLLRRLRALPREQYDVLLLHAVDGYSHDEIAAILNVTPLTSRKRLSRAKQWIVSRFDLDGSEMIQKKTIGHETD